MGPFPHGPMLSPGFYPVRHLNSRKMSLEAAAAWEVLYSWEHAGWAHPAPCFAPLCSAQDHKANTSGAI